MNIIPENCRILIINKPVNARLGIPGMNKLLLLDEFHVNWAGENICLVTFNEKLTMCKIFISDSRGFSLINRKLRSGKFKVLLSQGMLSKHISIKELNNLIYFGTTE